MFVCFFSDIILRKNGGKSNYFEGAAASQSFCTTNILVV